MSHLIVKAAFETRLETWAAAQTPPISVAFENVGFESSSASFVSGFLLPAETVSLSLDGSHRQFTGIYQVSIHSEVGIGLGYALGLAASLDILFPTTTPLVQGSSKIYVTRPMSLGPGIQDGGHLVIPASFQYHLDVI